MTPSFMKDEKEMLIPFVNAFDNIFGKSWTRSDRRKQWWDKEYLKVNLSLRALERRCKTSNGKWKSPQARSKYLSQLKSKNNLRKLKQHNTFKQTLISS